MPGLAREGGRPCAIPGPGCPCGPSPASPSPATSPSADTADQVPVGLELGGERDVAGEAEDLELAVGAMALFDHAAVEPPCQLLRGAPASGSNGSSTPDLTRGATVTRMGKAAVQVTRRNGSTLDYLFVVFQDSGGWKIDGWHEGDLFDRVDYATSRRRRGRRDPGGPPGEPDARWRSPPPRQRRGPGDRTPRP